MKVQFYFTTFRTVLVKSMTIPHFSYFFVSAAMLAPPVAVGLSQTKSATREYEGRHFARSDFTRDQSKGGAP